MARAADSVGDSPASWGAGWVTARNGGGTVEGRFEVTVERWVYAPPDLRVQGTYIVNHQYFEWDDGGGYFAGTDGLIYFDTSVANSGGDPSVTIPATTLRMYRSTGPTVTRFDTEVWSGPVPESGNLHETIVVAAPSVPGRYYYLVCVDPFPGEENTDDNCDLSWLHGRKHPSCSGCWIDFVSGRDIGKWWSAQGGTREMLPDTGPSAFSSITYTGVESVTARFRVDDEVYEAHVFEAAYDDSTVVKVMVDKAPFCSAVVTRDLAEAGAVRYATVLGRLPGVLRRYVKGFFYHPGCSRWIGVRY